MSNPHQISFDFVKAEPQSLFPSFDSLDDAIKYAESQIPLQDPYKVYSILMAYHNTLLKVKTQTQGDSHGT